MGVQHPAVGAVVVRRDDERSVGTQGSRPPGRRDGRRGVVGAGAGDDPDAVAPRALARHIDGRRDDALTLVGGQGRSLAGRPARDEAVDAGEQLPADELAELGLVERAVSGEWGHERGERTAERGSGRAGHDWSPSGRVVTRRSTAATAARR